MILDCLLKSIFTYFCFDEKIKVNTVCWLWFWKVFQIKSFGDIQEKDWLTKLKAQILEAQAIWKTEDYYIVLCTDAIYHKDKLRNAISDIEKLSNNKIHIIEPTQALSFYNFNDIDMFSIIYNFFHQNDSGLEKAKSCIASLSLKERKFLIDIIVNQFSSNDKGISLQEYDIPTDMDLCSFNNSRYYNLDEDNFTISYSYTENWDLTLFIVEIITKFRLHGNELKDFLLNQLCE